MIRSLLPLVGLVTLLGQAQAAVLRPIATLSGPHVYLRDLFDDAGPNADRVLGPGPAPGGRIIVGAAQLAAIARQFGVEWSPASTGDRAILEWPGRPLRREDALEAVRGALIVAGADPDCVIDLSGFNPPLVPLGVDPKPLVARMDFNPATGRFTALLSVTAEGMEPIAARIGGQVDTLTDVVVTVARMQPGAIAAERDLRIARVGSAQAKGDVLRDPAQVVGLMAKRGIPAGQPIRADDLVRPPVVARDTVVRLILDQGGLSVSGQGLALDSGATGERIRVRNPTSRAVLEGRVVGPGTVRISPGAMPLTIEASAQIRRAP